VHDDANFAIGALADRWWESFMRFAVAGAVLGLIYLSNAPAAELPSRKPGLWEVRTTIGNSNIPRLIQQCIDASTDQMLQSNAGPFAASTCREREVERSGNSVIIDSTCTMGGKAATSQAVVTGNFDSQYTMTVTSQSEELPGGKMTMTMEAKWLGPCAADQKPGDVIMSNGVKINIPEMQKRGLSPGSPLPQK
jgi:hypothetical protein